MDIWNDRSRNGPCLFQICRRKEKQVMNNPRPWLPDIATLAATALLARNGSWVDGRLPSQMGPRECRIPTGTRITVQHRWSDWDTVAAWEGYTSGIAAVGWLEWRRCLARRPLSAIAPSPRPVAHRPLVPGRLSLPGDDGSVQRRSSPFHRRWNRHLIHGATRRSPLPDH